MKKQSSISDEFYREYATHREANGIEWLAYLGGPCAYDGGLFVNRSAEDHKVSNKQWIVVETYLLFLKRNRGRDKHVDIKSH